LNRNFGTSSFYGFSQSVSQFSFRGHTRERQVAYCKSTRLFTLSVVAPVALTTQSPYIVLRVGVRLSVSYKVLLYDFPAACTCRVTSLWAVPVNARGVSARARSGSCVRVRSEVCLAVSPAVILKNTLTFVSCLHSPSGRNQIYGLRAGPPRRHARVPRAKVSGFRTIRAAPHSVANSLCGCPSVHRSHGSDRCFVQDLRAVGGSSPLCGSLRQPC
jgi:hypothetical protein